MATITTYYNILLLHQTGMDMGMEMGMDIGLDTEIDIDRYRYTYTQR